MGRRAAEKATALVRGRIDLSGDLTATPASQILDPTAPIPDGTRTKVLGKLAIRLRRVAGLSTDELLVTLMKRNERCVPPKSRRTFSSVWPATCMGNMSPIRSCTWAVCRLWPVSSNGAENWVTAFSLLNSILSY